MKYQRMGSFTSAPKIMNEDNADADIDITEICSRDSLIARCQFETRLFHHLIRRSFKHLADNVPLGNSNIRVLAWNMLSQALGEKNDSFVVCPAEALDWKFRRWRILEEILTYQPNIVCLQEVDHFNFLQNTLGSIGFSGTFFPKPDSPCYYIKGNNGPDGCAIFYDSNQYSLVRTETRILEVWSCQSNQVAILCVFRRKADGKEFCVATTHFKARQGSLLSTLRNEQGKDLVEFIKSYYGGLPLIITGDFNAEPTEPVYRTITTELPLVSSYCSLSNRHEEPPYTTWKIREEGEICHTIDYIFYTPSNLSLLALLKMPTEEDIGEGRIPSFRYPSDHFSLVSEFMISRDGTTTCRM